MLILGPTGSGKTTIANLLLGLLKSDSGTIKINGKPIDEIDIKSLRNIVAYVPQEPLIFGGSIKDNILFAVEKASEKDYHIAVQTSQLENEIASFPERDETFVGNRGLSVSGGQKQRLTICQSISKKNRSCLFWMILRLPWMLKTKKNCGKRWMKIILV